MKKPQHTPGPWLEANGNFVYALHEFKGRQVNRFSAFIDHYPSQGGTAEEGAANARLIAAAPELLEAAELHEAALAELDHDKRETMLIEAGKLRRAAIAKAKP